MMSKNIKLTGRKKHLSLNSKIYLLAKQAQISSTTKSLEAGLKEQMQRKKEKILAMALIIMVKLLINYNSKIILI